MGQIENEQLTAICLEGSPFDIGKKHGTLLREEITGFLQNDLAQINGLRSHPLDPEQVPAVAGPYLRAIGDNLPELMEEMEGLAAGAGITVEQAVLLQIRRELIGTGHFTLTGDCSSFGLHTADRVIVGQTIDLNGNMTGLGRVFNIKPGDHAPEMLMYSFAGLLGYMGMNSAGVAVAINLVISDGWRPGIPPYLLVRRLLACTSVKECLCIIEQIPRASSRSFIICDREQQLIVEMTPSQHRVIEGTFLAHTNHYLHPDLIAADRMNIFSRNSSIQRLRILQQQLNDPGLSQQHIQEVFSGHTLYPTGICAHNQSNVKRNETVASVIMYPLEGIMWALKGKPCTGQYTPFRFEKD
jgi:hypothetical protein